ncbi:MAG TPA: glycosyltransferase [Actinomycetota bacterium]|mgnify:CR=1 FL=1|nr:glycosyltransferase [Actinomycetota bacterium]HNL51447.1 glycosyltransferase [Actinomycetota bacterium]HNO15014.1 glycosyltransferase [Actinomycetota bacterium]
MPRLLIVSPYGTVAGGAEQWLLGILHEGALARAGWEVDAIVMQEGPLRDALREESVTTIALTIPASPVGIAMRVPSLRRAILARSPDVVVGNGVKAQLAVTMALAGSRIPTIWVKHDHSHDRALARILGQRATYVVPTALEVGLPTGRTDAIVIEAARPPEPLPAHDAKQELQARGWTPERRLTLGTITRLVPYKGVDLAIQALADPGSEQWNLLVIGGDDPATPDESTRLGTLAENLGVADRVFLAGAIPGAGRLLTAVDAVGVLTRPGQPGAPTKEGYGIVASEAMMAAVPVVVAQSGPISRRLDTPEGPAGITLAAPEPPLLAQALHTLSADDVRHRLGAAGRAAAQDFPTQTDIARQFVDVVERARGGR